jgi:hypothetical protein
MQIVAHTKVEERFFLRRVRRGVVSECRRLEGCASVVNHVANARINHERNAGSRFGKRRKRRPD